MTILKNHSLKPYNTFGVDASAKEFIEIQHEDELKEILLSQEYRNKSKFILGGGSNILFTKDLTDSVLKISVRGIEIINESGDYLTIRAGAGEIWHDLVLYTVERNLGGIENLSLIPGTVGAAPIQNIGAYGQELSETFVNLEGYYIDNGSYKKFEKEECRFGYRDSIFKQELKGKFVITHVTLKLNKNPIVNINYGSIKSELQNLGMNNPTVMDISSVIIKIRRSKLPDPNELGNAGSFFKNPEVSTKHLEELKKKFPDIISFSGSGDRLKIPAAWLIEKCGWKGKRIGDTGSHSRQALVIVNYGNATGAEIVNLANEIKKSVKEQFDIILEEEVNIV